METAPTTTERFDRLFAAHFESVRAYAWRRDPTTADDVAAETFLVAWRRLDHVPSESLPWLIGVARNVRLNVLRSERRRAALDARLAGTAAPDVVEPEHRVVSADVGAALARLSERDREVVLLAAWEGLDTAGIACALGCSRANASLRLFRARKRLAALLGDDPAPAPIGGASDAC
jgi:RNA polymerase sigma-70 factor (ECF subfamily)